MKLIGISLLVEKNNKSKYALISERETYYQYLEVKGINLY